jgi:hypothetical protein
VCGGEHGRFSAVGLAMRLGSFCGLAVAEMDGGWWIGSGHPL